MYMHMYACVSIENTLGYQSRNDKYGIPDRTTAGIKQQVITTCRIGDHEPFKIRFDCSRFGLMFSSNGSNRNTSADSYMEGGLCDLRLILSTVCQNAIIPSVGSSFVCGLILYSFHSCHKFSIGLQSGDSGDAIHQFIAFLEINC